MRLDGTGRRWLTDDDTKDQIAGDWSPDGQRVARVMFARCSFVSMDLYATPVDGGVLKPLTETVTTYNSFDLFGLPT